MQTRFFVERIAAPLVASSCALAITHPIDTARIRISMNYFRNPKEMMFHGILSCWGFMKLEERIKSLSKGDRSVCIEDTRWPT
jgi:hypothetical protein